MPIQDTIQQVLAKRSKQSSNLEHAERHLQTLEDQLHRLRDIAISVSKDEKAPQDFLNATISVPESINQLLPRISYARERILNLRVRFQKDAITLGVAGKAGQGKSTFLLSLSGLDKNVIPSASGKPVTGAKSQIVHSLDAPRAVVEFFTEEEFLREIVSSYYSDLGMLPSPSTLAGFRSTLPTLTAQSAGSEDKGKILKQGIYKKLVELHHSLPTFEKLLSSPPKQITLDEVRDYISQEDGRKKYLAVRLVTIYTRFPNIEVANLSFIDLPGLGELARGHDRKLVSALQKELDAVILVYRPDPLRVHWTDEDLKVFDIVNSNR